MPTSPVAVSSLRVHKVVRLQYPNVIYSIIGSFTCSITPRRNSIIHAQTLVGKRKLKAKDVLLLDFKPEPAIFLSLVKGSGHTHKPDILGLAK